MRLQLLTLLLQHSTHGLVQPPRRASSAVIAQAARTGKRQRVASWFRRRRRREYTASSERPPLSQLERDSSLSVTCWEAMIGLEAPQTLADRRLAFRVGKDAPWTIVIVDSSCSVAVEIESCLERPAVDAAVTYANEQVFEALMDEKYSSAAAVATRRLRISGSLSVASASEPLFDAVEVKLRNTRAVAVGGAEAAAARSAAAEATLDARLRDAAARPPFERWRARHVGTDQQVALRVHKTCESTTKLRYTHRSPVRCSCSAVSFT
jgi:putative sterol carrier protein